ncbi:succinate dehydrogenase assembly factor 2, mitochondrial [Cinnamomum micranthum f. kanehirae]|uniref:Succinate dehydrogenase assembly factor 2, mitochondrial n=1 Tax=Cinnamomum micranthum f. kanehirae TaxID=337451 RepID=A0A3S3QL81_9MAGN|nr:succinate dehydrogenase assembly factor 2, mitochondrial [Cinnamomum micranthum f. kanehirae]
MASLRRALFRLHQTLNSPVLANPNLPKTLIHQRSVVGSVSRFNSDRGSIDIDLSNEESKRRLFNRLLYRSKQRGFLELDLVLGKWVEDHIRVMDEAGIKALVDVLDLENPDLWKWLTGQEQPPEAVNGNPVFSAVRAKVMGNLNSHAAPETRATPGQPWVRGWDDKRGQEGPRYGNQ